MFYDVLPFLPRKRSVARAAGNLPIFSFGSCLGLNDALQCGQCTNAKLVFLLIMIHGRKHGRMSCLAGTP